MKRLLDPMPGHYSRIPRLSEGSNWYHKPTRFSLTGLIPAPILLIHGFNGSPNNWTGPDDHFPEYLAAQGFDPALIRVFDYGDKEYSGQRFYNNLGDLRQIAHRLDAGDARDTAAPSFAVDRLSRDSMARGGPRQVTLIAHSSGGLIARYYLSRRTEDEFGTRYRGNVRTVIFLGTPHQGVDIEDVLDPLPNHWIYGLMIRMHYLFPPEYHDHPHEPRELLLRKHGEAERDGPRRGSSRRFQETPAFKQMHPGSDFLDEINRPGAMPREVTYFNIVGDVRAGVRMQFGQRILVNEERDFGDFLVSKASAGVIPNAASDCYSIPEEYCLDVRFDRKTRRIVQVSSNGEHPTPLHRWLRSHPASRKRMLEILRASQE